LAILEVAFTSSAFACPPALTVLAGVAFKAKSGITKRAPDWWESARFQAGSVARSWFRQSGVVSSHPPAGNAPRWALPIHKARVGKTSDCNSQSQLQNIIYQIKRSRENV